MVYLSVKPSNKPFFREVEMIRKKQNQRSMTDTWINHPPKPNKTLERIDELVNWTSISERIEPLYSSNGLGRPGFSVIVMFKVLLLQSIYDLSDPGVEEAVADRLTFRKFLGLNLDDNIPDHSTVHRFRDRIQPIIDELFEILLQQIDDEGLILRKGTMIDASFVQAAAKEPEKKGQVSTSDPEASWGKKRNKLIYGYKMHVGVDKGSEIIRKVDFTPAHIHDNHSFKEMVSGDEKAVYADKGYFGQVRSDWLAAQGIEDRILIKGNKWHPLTEKELAFNKAANKVRRSVEHVFGTFKRVYKFRRCRYFTWNRNRFQFFVLCMSYNLKRSIKLVAT